MCFFLFDKIEVVFILELLDIGEGLEFIFLGVGVNVLWGVFLKNWLMVGVVGVFLFWIGFSCLEMWMGIIDGVMFINGGLMFFKFIFIGFWYWFGLKFLRFVEKFVLFLEKYDCLFMLLVWRFFRELFLLFCFFIFWI